MSDDLYAVLGVGRDASPGCIRGIGRAMLKQNHPDHNPGDDQAAARFARVERAVRVLSDPERRARYDATGEADEPPVDRGAAELAGTLCHALATVVRLASEQGVSVTAVNLVEHMRRFLREGAAAGEKKLAAVKRNADELALTIDRFTTHGDGENLLAAVARNHLAAVRKEEQMVEAELGRIRRAVEHLKTCGYRTDPRPLGDFAAWTFTRPV